jgi:hypothetical protein
MVTHTQDAFAAISSKNDEFRLVALSAQDLLYRFVAQLEILDMHTRFYVDQVVRAFFAELTRHQVRTFYILDNAIREDRFAALLEIFELAGIVAVTPRRDGRDWHSLHKSIITALESRGHAAYVEPDGEVNHLDAACALAKQSVCVATFRNLAPDDSRLEVVAFRVPQSAWANGP